MDTAGPDRRLVEGLAAETRGDFALALALFQDAANDPSPAVSAEGRLGCGRVEWKQGHYPQAMAALDRARAQALPLNNDELRARIENGVGAVYYSQGAYVQARASYLLARQLSSAQSFQAKIDLNLGVLANIEGDLAAARTYYERSRATFRALRDADNEAMALHNLGMLSSDEGDWEAADESFRGSLALFERSGNRQMIGSVKRNLAEVQYAQEIYEEALASAELAMQIAAEMGDEAGRAEALRWRGRAQHALGQFRRAARDLTDAAAIAERLNMRLLLAEVTWDNARLLRATGESSTAREEFQQALSLFTSLGAQREVEQVSAEMQGV